MFTSHIAGLIYDAVIEEAFDIGLLEVPPGAPSFDDARTAYTACTWTGPGMGWVDPKKEAEAAGLRVSGRFSTLEQENASQGNNWRDTLDQQAIEHEYARDVGLVEEGVAPAVDGDAGEDDDDTDADNTNADDSNETDAADDRESQESSR